MPLRVLWKELEKNRDNITPEYVWNIFLENPMITVTKEEDLRLKKVDPKNQMDAAQRYAAANIIVEIDNG